MFSRRRRINRRTGARQTLALSAVAPLALTPIVVVGAGAAYDLIEDNGVGPIDPIVQTKSLADSASVLVEDAAIATQGLIDDAHPNRGVVKEITSDTEFSQFALTWAGSADIASYVRAQRADGTWSDWFSADPEYPAEGNGNGLNGTELIYVEPTKRVQVSTFGLNIFGPGSGVDLKDIEGADKLDMSKIDINKLGGDAANTTEDAKATASEAVKDAAQGAKAAVEDAAAKVQKEASSATDDAPSDPKATAPVDSKAPVKWTDIEPVADELPIDQVDAVLIDGQAAESAVDPIVDAKNVTGMPKVITRAGWGANEKNRCLSPTYDDKLVGATVHHTAGSNNYTEAQSAGIVRGIYQYHAQTLGWCDIGYNALVDKYGNIFEGRYGGLDKNVQGAHAGGFNTGTFGISMMGNYSTVAPSEATLTSVGNMIGWRLKVAGIKPTGQIQMTSGGTSYSKYRYGTKVTLPTIFAHRDVGSTTCPGDSGYAQMDKIRATALKKYEALSHGQVDNEGPSGHDDLLVPPGSHDGSSSSVTSSSSATTTTSPTSTKTSTTTTSPTRTSTTTTAKPSTPKTSTTKTSSTKTSTTTTATKSPTVSTTSASSATASSASSSSTSTATSEPTDATDTGSTDGVGTAGAVGSAGESSLGSYSPSLPEPTDQQKAAAVEAISGARSMLASALGMLGAPGLGQTADVILASVGRSVENGPSISELSVVAAQIIEIDQHNDLAAEWRKVSEELGAVLGYAMSGIQSGSTVSNSAGKADAIRYVKFSNGVITDSETTGTHAVWGKIADEWARQGFEVGKLGAPTKTQTINGNIERAEFQHGSITLNRTTGKVTTQLN